MLIYIYETSDIDGKTGIYEPGPPPPDAFGVNFFGKEITVSTTLTKTANHIRIICGAILTGHRLRSMRASDYQQMENDIGVLDRLFGHVTKLFSRPQLDQEDGYACVSVGYTDGHSERVDGGIEIIYKTFTRKYHADNCNCEYDLYVCDHGGLSPDYRVSNNDCDVCICHVKNRGAYM